MGEPDAVKKATGVALTGLIVRSVRSVAIFLDPAM